MSKPKKFSELPLVSDIGAANLLVVDDTGVKRTPLPEASWQQRHQASVESNGKWYRIADVNRSGAGFIVLKGSYTQSRPAPCVLAIAFDAHGGFDGPHSARCDAKLLVGHPDRMTKIRFVVDAFNSPWAGHIDMFIAQSTIMPRVEIVALSGLGILATEIAEAPSAESANTVKEFDLTQSGG